MARKPDETSWIILRMASADTLKVVDRLEERGFAVWSPAYSVRDKDSQLALMPSYAFAHMKDMAALIEMTSIQTTDAPRFAIFRTATGHVPLIDDQQLEGLRSYEQRLQAQYEKLSRKGQPLPKIDAGTVVRMPEGAFTGLDGTVVEQQGSFTLVAVEGWPQPIKVSSLLFCEDVKSEVNPKACLRHRNRHAA